MRARSATLAVLLAALCVLAPIPAAAQPGSGTVAPQTLITDPAGDQAVTAEVPDLPTEPDYTGVDITTVTVAEEAGNVLLAVTTSAAPTATQTLSIRFGLERGPLSLPGSTAEGVDFAISIVGTNVAGVQDATAAVSGSTVTVTLPRTSLGATGGDLIVDLTVEAKDADDGPTPATADDSEAVDKAPDTGAAEAYALDRVAPNAALALTGVGGTVLTADGNSTTFAGAAVSVTDPSADVIYNVRVTNIGTDAEDVLLATGGGLSSNHRESLNRESTTLLPGQSTNFTYTLRLANAVDTVTGQVVATGHRGGTATLSLAATVLVPVISDGPRTPTPAGLGFLTPAAEAIGFDKAFGDYAELALLLLILLVVVILVFVLLLRKGPWIRVKVTPKHAVVAPGGVARFDVALTGKGGDRTARALLEGGDWPAGLDIGGAHATKRETAEFSVSKDGTHGVLEVRVPGTVEPKARQSFAIDATPVEEGEEVPRRRGHAKVTVQAGIPSQAESGQDLEVHLTNIQHDPARPVPGATVTTSATLQNDGASSAYMRVVLMLDGKAVKEENVEIPPATSRVVQLPWVAMPGPTRVKVQAFLA